MERKNTFVLLMFKDSAFFFLKTHHVHVHLCALAGMCLFSLWKKLLSFGI